jgi:hypothetical protein
MTTLTPPPSAEKTFAFTADAWVKSTSTSARTASSASATDE